MNRDAGKTRVLVIGSTGHSPEVTCLTWSDLGPTLDPIDFEAVVVNLASLPRDSTLLRPERFASPRFAKLVESDGVLVVILPPDLAGRKGSAMGWLPFRMEVRPGGGDTMEALDPAFRSYTDLVRRWTFRLEGPCIVQHRVGDTPAGTVRILRHCCTEPSRRALGSGSRPLVAAGESALAVRRQRGRR